MSDRNRFLTVSDERSLHEETGHWPPDQGVWIAPFPQSEPSTKVEILRPSGAALSLQEKLIELERENRRLQGLVSELLIKNQQLRWNS